jgi:ATP-binding cassette subfamily C protein
VSLVYDDGTKALSEVSASIPIGSVTAIVGPSGAGKSTLADLVMGLAVPTSGAIALDGRPLDAAGRRAWRAHVGYVPQDAFLFHESIRDNLLAARPGAADAELWEALEAADATNLVRSLPDGLETIAGERGTRLSGGEAQRIALARALLRHPALLVLDEPTSALDADSEARIIATIERLKGRHTIVIVAHRQALAAIADQTIALDRGRRTA